MLRLARLRLLARAWRGDTRAIAATEFAMILPLMVLLYAGVVDLNRAAIECRKVETVSEAISGLVSQQPTQTQLGQATIAAILSSATAIMAPYPATALTMTVTAVVLTPRHGGTCCDATVLWSYARGGASRACGTMLTQAPSNAPPSPTTIPAAIVKNTILGPYASATMVIADVGNTYRPIFGQAMAALTGGMDRTTYALVRGAGVLNVTQPFAAGAANTTTCG